jgi:hypothetical protein
MRRAPVDTAEQPVEVKAGNTGTFRNTIQVDRLLVVFIDEQLRRHDALVYVSRDFHAVTKYNPKSKNQEAIPLPDP